MMEILNFVIIKILKFNRINLQLVYMKIIIIIMKRIIFNLTHLTARPVGLIATVET